MLMVLRLLVSGEARLIRLCLYAIPIIFCVIFYSFLLGNRVLSHFESYMQESYVGMMGELSVTSPSSHYIQALYQDSLASGYQVSEKLTQQVLLAVKSSRLNLVKGLQLYVYSGDYLNKKFALKDHDKQTLIVSSIVAKQLALSEQDLPIKLADPHIEVDVSFQQLKIVDLGFLTAQPIIMLSAAQYQKLMNIAVSYKQLEFYQLPAFAKQKIEQLASQRFNSAHYSSYKLIDTQSLSSEHESVFNALHWFSYIVFTILILLNLCLSVLAVKTILSAKKAAIQTLQLLGMTWQELWSYLLFAWLALLITSYLLCSFLVNISQQQVLNFIF